MHYNLFDVILEAQIKRKAKKMKEQMEQQVIQILIKQGFDETEAEQMASVMGEIELFEVIEQGGV